MKIGKYLFISTHCTAATIQHQVLREREREREATLYYICSIAARNGHKVCLISKILVGMFEPQENTK